ncbi:isoaspartyl peptidase/L-asparaginase [Pipistrellus kuhlii]|uniref:Isoaspartyl peptidase/L-asparaginase n=1 Tax=Pipistrellus kuhlii TaxID=59472 RepID=A0A7J7RTU4_PIPKU|nr:isoaspartyl peptidase/L-asparaginase [Pipistrellus kuhlii]KAF6279385.1 asparaginase and isoaspartyl peptidase 1 [Pipistrellus kuhlii]
MEPSSGRDPCGTPAAAAVSPVVVVHGGGACHIAKDRKEMVRQGVLRAASAGFCALKAGGSAVDAVECAVSVLEDDPEFNAGYGSVLNANGDVEMDASIMSGKDLSSGAVSAIRCIANPIKLARLVMEKTPHCFLTDRGAAEFATAMGVRTVTREQLVTEKNRKRLEKEKRGKEGKDAQKLESQKHLGTVGAVALDSKGDVAYATSTGGIVNKMVGRVGDTPCIGCGGYADNDIGAISTTGHGESILKVNLARLTLFHVEQGKTLEEAAEVSLNYMKSKVKGLGGVILVNKAGQWAVKWTSESMPWAAAQAGKLHCGIDLNTTTVTDML